MAMAASRLTRVPWSLTAHRWDIAENNLLRVKAREASFFRVISEHGARELEVVVGVPGWSPWVLHMGVELPVTSVPAVRRTPLRVLVAARLVEKKGHTHLIEAASILRSRGCAIHVDLAGDGPLEADLRRQVSDSGLAGDVDFLGTVSHDGLLARVAAGDWDVAALPSVVTPSGELEGIPMSLVEAMAHGLPALATATGGIRSSSTKGRGCWCRRRTRGRSPTPSSSSCAVRTFACVSARQDGCGSRSSTTSTGSPSSSVPASPRR